MLSERQPGGGFSLSANHRRDKHKRWLLATHNQSQTSSFWLCHSLLCLAAHHSPRMCVSLSVSRLCYTASFILTADRSPVSFSDNIVLRDVLCLIPIHPHSSLASEISTFFLSSNTHSKLICSGQPTLSDSVVTFDFRWHFILFITSSFTVVFLFFYWICFIL